LTEKLSQTDVLAKTADFDGVVIGKSQLDLLALYLALAHFDEGMLDGGEIFVPDDD
jgi:hypothetical protein